MSGTIGVVVESNTYDENEAGLSPVVCAPDDIVSWSEGQRLKKLERRDAATRQALANPSKRASVYRRLVTTSPLVTDAECRFLCTLTYQWGHELTNCFPSRASMAASLAGSRSIARIDQLLRSCERKGFLRRVRLTRDECGDLIEAETGRFVSAVGCQFLLPAGAITPISESWEGPKAWSRRLYGQRTES